MMNNIMSGFAKFLLLPAFLLLATRALICGAAETDSFLDVEFNEAPSNVAANFIALCQSRNRPCGFEKQNCALRPSSYSLSSTHAEKTTLRKALDQAARRYPGHKWTVRDGVINLEPTARTAPDLLSRKLDKISLRGVPSNEAVHLVFKQAGIRTGGSAYSGPGPIYASINLELKDITVREAINAIAKADGQIAWSSCLDKPEQSRIGFYLSVWRRLDVRTKEK